MHVSIKVLLRGQTLLGEYYGLICHMQMTRMAVKCFFTLWL